MKIDIGCCVDLCEATAFVELRCNGFDEPLSGLFLPVGWDMVETSLSTVKNKLVQSISFLCPKHAQQHDDDRAVRIEESKREPSDPEHSGI